jgi:pimeloyl-ACP methyl ester carboxylesterase/DNA-binding CsgD family transcriptional regulator
MDDQIRFCRTTDGVRIAFRQLGAGPTIVFPAWWYNHLDVLWEAGPARTFFETLAEQYRVVLYDRPGCGLSDREPPDLTLDDELRTLEALVDALDLHRFALFGFSQGGPPAVAYAARHPERVAHLSLFATMARAAPPPDSVQAAAVREAMEALIRAEWGLGSATLAQFSVPGADPAYIAWLGRYMRASVEPETAIAMLRAYREIDVSDMLPAMRTPTLVMHRRDDRAMPFERGRELAAGIAGARFVPLEGSWHQLYEGEVQDVLAQTIAFLTEGSAIGEELSGSDRAAYPDGLSEREVQVLRLLAAGQSNKEIAAWLVLSPHTITRHISNIFDKTGVRNRAEAATYANRHGLVE